MLYLWCNFYIFADMGRKVILNLLFWSLMSLVCLTNSHTFEDDIVDFLDMGNFDHVSQKNIVKKDKRSNVEGTVNL